MNLYIFTSDKVYSEVNSPLSINSKCPNKTKYNCKTIHNSSKDGYLYYCYDCGTHFN